MYGLTTKDNFEKDMNSYLDKKISKVFKSMGRPIEVLTSKEDSKIYVYYVTIEKFLFPKGCNVYFEVNYENIITNWTTRGVCK